MHCFTDFTNFLQSCRRDIEKYKPAYKTITSVGMSLLKISHGNTTQSISMLLQKIDESWLTLQDNSGKKIESLRSALEAWEEYTEQMEDLMGWLRSAEKIVRYPLGGFTKKELEEQLLKCRVCV